MREFRTWAGLIARLAPLHAPKFGANGTGIATACQPSTSRPGNGWAKQTEIGQAVIQRRQALLGRCTSGMVFAENVFSIRFFPATVGLKQQERFMENRRSTRLVCWICAVGIALATTPSFAQQKPLQKARLAVGTTVLNVGYPMLTLAVTLGYWKEEGYDVELLPVGASLQAIQQMVAGNAEFAEVNASVIVQSNAKNDLPVRIVMANGVIDWAVAVDADGPIKSVKDLTALVIAMARGAAKATVFALANPDCARKLHWARYPSTKPTGADEATLIKWDMNNQQAQLDSLSDGYKLNGGKLWGNIDPAAFDRLIAFMVAAKQIDKTMPAKGMVVGIHDFFTKVNAFDVKAIEDSAKACR